MAVKTAPVTLLWGEDAYLVREAALAVLDGIKATEVDAAEWQGGELQGLATPSLFGEPRALLVNDAKSLRKETLEEISRYLEAPDPDATLVLACVVADRGKVPAGLQKLVASIGEVRKVDIARRELEPWLVARAKQRGLDLAIPGARALVETLGPEPGQLVAALEQLQDVFAGQRIGPREIAQQFRGLGEQKTWDLCDRAFGKDLPGAIRSLRAIEEGGDDALMVLGGYRRAPPRSPEGAVAPGADAAGRGGQGSRPPVRLAGSPVSAAGEELLDAATGRPARRDHGRRSRAEVRRDR